jgi:hypothetical protein
MREVHLCTMTGCTVFLVVWAMCFFQAKRFFKASDPNQTNPAPADRPLIELVLTPETV